MKQRGIHQRGIDLIFGSSSPLSQEDIEKVIEPKPKIILYLKDGLNGAERNFTKYPNEIHEVMRENLKEEAEGILYIYLWRQSWGYGRNYCRTSYSTITKETIIGSQKTAQRAMSKLLEKHFVVKALLEDGQANVTNDGGLYRIITPEEIKNGKTEEGVPLDKIPIEGTIAIAMPSIGMVKMTIANMTSPENNQENANENKDLEDGIVNLTSGQNDYSQNDYSQNDQTGIAKMTIVKMTRGEENKELTSNEVRGSQNDHSQNDQHLKDIFKDSLKDTLSPREICSLFYSSIGQTKISKKKRERAEINIKELLSEGFSKDDILLTIKWTIENSKEKPYDFSIIKETIGQAIAVKKQVEAEEAKKLEAEQNKIYEMEKEKKENENQERIRTYKGKLSVEQRSELRAKALDEIHNMKGIKEEFITETLIEAKENELVAKRLGIDLPE